MKELADTRKTQLNERDESLRHARDEYKSLDMESGELLRKCERCVALWTGEQSLVSFIWPAIVYVACVFACVSVRSFPFCLILVCLFFFEV